MTWPPEHSTIGDRLDEVDLELARRESTRTVSNLFATMGLHQSSAMELGTRLHESLETAMRGLAGSFFGSRIAMMVHDEVFLVPDRRSFEDIMREAVERMPKLQGLKITL